MLSDEYVNTTVIHGTHNPRDLVPAFAFELTLHDEDFSASQVSADVATMLGDDAADWEGEDVISILIELEGRLEDLAPEGCYFGAHPGDGSDFGFWTFED